MIEREYVFISYARANKDFVERLIADLQSHNLNIWIDTQGLKAGTPNWEQALRDAIHHANSVLLIASPDSRQSPYVADELGIAAMYKRPVYPIWAMGEEWMDSIRVGLGSVQFIDARGARYSTAVQEIIATLNSQSAISLPPLPRLQFEPRNPYKGLNAFTRDDRGDFFGREAVINELVSLVEKSENERFLAVIGPSGSGKSSVVMAGLLPRLAELHRDWIFLEPMVPGKEPLKSLCITLSRVMPAKSIKVIREDLDDLSTQGLDLLARSLVIRSNVRVVLTVDQFEELFTQTANEAERRQFIDLLVTATTELNGVLTVILTLRADFYDRPMAYTNLLSLIENHSKLIPPLSLSDLRDVIEQPADLPDVKLTFDEGLVAELVFVVRDQIGALPLLQFTLDQLFQHRKEHQLTFAAYSQIGGVKGALAKHAETTYTNLPSDEHCRLARAMFLRLIEPGVNEQDTTRRRSPLESLALPDAKQASIMGSVADSFVQARLLTTNKIADVTTIEISHEALIREWKRLGEWLKDARDDVQLQRTISEDAEEWIRRGQPITGDMLYRGTVLLEAQSWAKRNVPSAKEMAFIDASAIREAQLAELEEQRKQELIQANILLEEYAAELAEASKMKSEFLAMMSHELRTPMNAIIGYSELLQSGMYGELNEKQSSRMERILLSARRLLNMINDILDISRIDAGKMHLQLEPVDLKQVVVNAIENIQSSAIEKGLYAELNIPDNLPLVSADDMRLKQIIINLISNAVKFTEHGGFTVRAEMVEENGEQKVCTSVIDTGIGVSPENQELIFDEFRQVNFSSSTEHQYRGTGLGLALVKKLINLMNGRIWVESELGKGSKFVFTLTVANVPDGNRVSSSMRE